MVSPHPRRSPEQGQDGSKGDKGDAGSPGNPGEAGLRGKDVSKSHAVVPAIITGSKKSHFGVHRVIFQRRMTSVVVVCVCRVVPELKENKG